MKSILSYEDEIFYETTTIEENTRIIANTCSMFSENPDEVLAKLNFFFLFRTLEQPYLNAIEESHIFDVIAESIYQIPNTFPKFDLLQAFLLISKLFTATSFVGKMFNTPEFLVICKSLLEIDTFKYMERVCGILVAFLRANDGFVKIIELGFPEIVFQLLDTNNHSVRMNSLVVLKNICECINYGEFLMRITAKVLRLALNETLYKERSEVCIEAMLCLKSVCANSPEICQELAKFPSLIFQKMTILQDHVLEYHKFYENYIDVLSIIIKTVQTIKTDQLFKVYLAFKEINFALMGLNYSSYGTFIAKCIDLLFFFLNTRNEQFLSDIFEVHLISQLFQYIFYGSFIVKQPSIKFIHALILYDPEKMLKEIDSNNIFRDILIYDNETQEYILKSINRLSQYNNKSKALLQNYGVKDQLNIFIAHSKDQNLIEMAQEALQNLN